MNFKILNSEHRILSVPQEDIPDDLQWTYSCFLLGRNTTQLY